MRPMLLHDAERQQAGALRAGDAVLEVGSGQLFPMHRQLGLCRLLRPHDRGAEYVDRKQQWLVHVFSSEAVEPIVGSKAPTRYPIEAARTIRNNPAPRATAPVGRATRPPPRARRLAVVAGGPAALARKAPTPQTHRDR